MADLASNRREIDKGFASMGLRASQTLLSLIQITSVLALSITVGGNFMRQRYRFTPGR
jgi:hypothetical protein